MPKSRGRKPKKKRGQASASKKGLDNFNTTPQELPLSTQPPQGPPAGDGATPRAAHTKNKKDREGCNGCCPCGHRDSPVCLCVYFDETMRSASSAVAAMVTGRDAFPSVSVGIGGSQKVELRSPRPALMYGYRAAAALPFTAQAQESVGLRRRTSRNHRPSKAEPLSIRSLSCGLSWAILRLADSHG